MVAILSSVPWTVYYLSSVIIAFPFIYRLEINSDTPWFVLDKLAISIVLLLSLIWPLLLIIYVISYFVHKNSNDKI